MFLLRSLDTKTTFEDVTLMFKHGRAKECDQRGPLLSACGRQSQELWLFR